MAKLSKEDQEKLRREASQHKLQKVSIPNGAESYWLIYDITYTKSALAKADESLRPPNLLDGIAVKMACIGYVVDKKRKICIDYSDLENVKFPCDIVDETTGEVTYMTGLTHTEYLTVQRLTSKVSPYGGYNMPNSEKLCALLYDASFCRQFGREEFELLTCILNTKISPNLTWQDFASSGIEQGEPEYPIIPAYRYIDMRYDSRDLIKGKPIEGAIKRPVATLKVWNRAEGNDELKKVPTKWIPEKAAMAIMNAIVEREARKHAAINPLEDKLPVLPPF